MKRSIGAVIIVAAGITLTGCTSGATEPPDSSAVPAGQGEVAVVADPDATRPSGAGGLNEGYADALPVVSQLIAGSMMLEKAGLAIDKDEAGKLLPLWQAYQSLNANAATAPAELEAIVKQIQRTMTPEQIGAIAAMKLTSESVGQAMRDGEFGAFRGGFGGGRQGQAGSRAAQGGDFPGGGPGQGGAVLPLGPGGPEGFPGVGPGVADPQAVQTAVARRGAGNGRPAGDFLVRGLAMALITDLQVRSGAVTEEQLALEQAQRSAGRWIRTVSEAAGVPEEKLRAAFEGGKSMADAIVQEGGDRAAAEAKLAEMLKQAPGLDDAAIAAQIKTVLETKGGPLMASGQPPRQATPAP